MLYAIGSEFDPTIVSICVMVTLHESCPLYLTEVHMDSKAVL